MRAAAARRAPFFAHAGVTGPHLPSIPAPWHAGLVGAWESARDFAAPRTPTFNERIATDRAAKGCEIPNFKGSYLGRFPLVSADFWTSDHLSERSRSADAFSGTRARGTLTLKRR